MSRTSITVPESLLEWFQSYCERQKRSVSAQISFMIEELKEEKQSSGDGDRKSESIKGGDDEA